MLENFRPVWNLPFVSKLIQKKFLDQLLCHLNQSNLWHISNQLIAQNTAPRQLSFVFSVTSWLLLDSCSISILTLLDLSAAFDTIDHSILLTLLKNTFGVCDLALSFFYSYQQCRTQAVTVNKVKFRFLLVVVHPLSDVISHHSVIFDSQLSLKEQVNHPC